MEFRILGPLEAAVEDGKLVLPPGKPRALLALLVLRRNRVVPVEAIVDALWHDDPPATAGKIVQTYVSQLRRALGDDAIVTRGRGYVLNVHAGALDSERAAQLRDEARGHGPASAATLLSDALALWRGSPLQEVEYDDFAQAEIRRLEELRLGIVADRIDVELELGRHADALGELEALAAEHPFDERLRAQLMLALYRSGRQTEALQAYQEYRRRLSSELGLEPGEELRALEHRILSHDTELAAPERVGVPGERVRLPVPSRRRTLLLAGGAVVLVLAVTAVVRELARSGDQAGLAGVVSNSVGVIDPRTNRIVAQIPVGNSPTRIAVGERAIWVLNADDRTIVQIDPASRRPTRTFTAARVPTDIAVGFGSVWVAGSDPVEVVRVDPRSGAVTQRVVLSPLAASVSPVAPGVHLVTGFGSVWVSAPTRPRDAFIARIDPASSRVSAKLRRVYAGPVAIGAEAVWMVKWGALTHIDPSTNSLTQRSYEVGLDGRIAADDRFVWIADELGGSVWQLDAGNWRVMRSIQVGSVPSDVAIGFASLWVAGGDGTVSRIDLDSGRVVAVIRTGGAARAIAVGNGMVWVTVT
jgi:YVTN family beta-propeller protein